MKQTGCTFGSASFLHQYPQLRSWCWLQGIHQVNRNKLVEICFQTNRSVNISLQLITQLVAERIQQNTQKISYHLIFMVISRYFGFLPPPEKNHDCMGHFISSVLNLRKFWVPQVSGAYPCSERILKYCWTIKSYFSTVDSLVGNFKLCKVNV